MVRTAFAWLAASLTLIAMILCGVVAPLAAQESSSNEDDGGELLELVIDFMSDSDRDTRAIALEYVRSGIPGNQATVRLAEQLSRLAPEAQSGLLSALTDRGDRAARPAIAALLASAPDASVRIAAIRSLGYLGTTDDLPALLHYLNGGTENERTEADAALARMASETLSRAIAAELADASPSLRVTLINILARRRAADTVGIVLDYVTNDDAAVRGEAMAMLGQLAGPQHVRGMLQGVLRAEAGRERETAERCVMFVCQRIVDPDKRANPVLAAMREMDNADRATLLSTLGRIGGPLALEVIESVIAKTDAGLHDLGIRALCNWPDASIAPRLIELIGSDPHPQHQLAALRALIRVAPLTDDRTDTQRLALLQQAFTFCTRDTERNLVLERASAVRTVESLRFVLPYVDQPAHRESACFSVVELAHQRALRDAHQDEFTAALEKVKAVAENPVFRDRAEAYMNSETWPGPRR